MNHFREAPKPVAIHGHKGRPKEECHFFFPALLAGFGTLLGCFLNNPHGHLLTPLIFP